MCYISSLGQALFRATYFKNAYFSVDVYPRTPFTNYSCYTVFNPTKRRVTIDHWPSRPSLPTPLLAEHARDIIIGKYSLGNTELTNSKSAANESSWLS